MVSPSKPFENLTENWFPHFLPSRSPMVSCFPDLFVRFERDLGPLATMIKKTIAPLSFNSLAWGFCFLGWGNGACLLPGETDYVDIAVA